jgi:uncharacterized protein (TIGR02246 family)
MIRRLGASISAASLSLLFATAAIAGPDEDQVSALYTAWSAAFNNMDAKALGTFYTADAIFLPINHQVLRGPDGVERYYNDLFGASLSSRNSWNHKFELIEAHGNGTMLFGTAKWSVQGQDSKGQPATFTGTSMHVFEKQPDGSWKIRASTYN